MDLFNKIHSNFEELLRLLKNQEIKDLFTFIIRSTRTCLSCFKTIVMDEECIGISLNVTKDLFDSFIKFSKEEILDYECSCGHKKSLRKLEIISFPKYLFIALKRFNNHNEDF